MDPIQWIQYGIHTAYQCNGCTGAGVVIKDGVEVDLTQLDVSEVRLGE